MVSPASTKLNSILTEAVLGSNKKFVKLAELRCAKDLFIAQPAPPTGEMFIMAPMFRPVVRYQPSRVYMLTAALFLASSAMSLPAHAAGCKVPKSFYKHVSCTADSRYFLAVKDSGAPVALIDKNGKGVVDLSRYQEVAADKISGGLIPVKRGNKVGYVNLKGREVVPAVYDILSDGVNGWARPVSDGLIVVKSNGSYGVINTSNKVVVSFSRDITTMGDYRSGRVQVTKAGQGVQALDKKGNIIKSAPAPQSANNNNRAANNNSPNNSGANNAAPPRNSFTTLYPHQQDGRWGFVDDQDVTMITYSFDEVMPFAEGLAGVRIANNWGFVNLGGELVIPFRFDDAGVDKAARYQGVKPFTFKNNKAWVGSLKSGIKICINKEGTNVNCD